MTTTQTVTIEWLREDFCHWIEYRCSQLGFAVSGRHTKMAKWIQGPNPMKVCMGWRGCGKTYWLGREYILWRWLRNPWIKVLSICNTDANAGNVTSSVLEILRSEPAVQKYAPRRLVAEKFFDLVGFKPEKGRSIRAAGIDTTLTSERADLIVVDDPESDAEPETRYERILAVLDECMAILSSPNRLYPGREVPPQERTQLLVLGQPHWIGSAYIPPTIDPITKEVPPHPLRSADWLWIPALVDEHDNPCDEEPHCQSSVPEIHSTDLMLAKKAAMRPQKWRLEFQLDVSPENAERAVILLDHIRRRVVDPAHPIAVVDPADSGDACEWGFAVAGLEGDRICFCNLTGYTEDQVMELKSIDDHELVADLMWMHIFDVCKFWGVRKLYIEKNCVPAIRSARRYISRSQIPCGVEEFHETGNKLKRIVDAWEIPVKSGMIDMHPAIFKDYRTVKQMLDLRHTKLPSPNDRIDAGAKAIRILSESSSVIASTEGPRMMDLDGWLADTVDQDRGVHAFGPTCGLSHQARFGR